MVSEELWMPWSDTLGEYCTPWKADDEKFAWVACNTLNASAHPGDWRPVRIPPGNELAPIDANGGGSDG